MSDLLPTPVTDALVRGAVELDAGAHGLLPRRLPAWALAQANDPGLTQAALQPAGVRLVATTAATVVELVVHRTRTGYRGMPPRPEGVLDLVVDGEPVAQATTSGGLSRTVDVATGAVETIDDGPGVIRFDGLPSRHKRVEVWLPTHEQTELVELRSDAPLEPIADPGRRWVHHGSSISQGSNADRPTATWVATAARRAGVEVTNLGFGGNALLDPFVARVIRDLPADVVSVEVGINLVNLDLFRRRALAPAVHGLLDTIRDGHPTTPLVVVSPLYCPMHEDTPGPGEFDPDALARGEVRFRATGDPAEATTLPTGKLTLRVVREELARVVAERCATDPQLSLVDGLDLFGPADHDRHPLPDALHPDAAAHRLVGERFVARVLAR